MQKIDYWQLNFETKLNLADAWISNLTFQYIESKIKQKKPQDAIKFSEQALRTQEVFNAFKTILTRAQIENNILLKECAKLKTLVEEYESDNLAIDMQSLSELKSQMERDMRKEMQEFKDKYQLQIQQLEKDKDKLIQQLINKK
jgi:hypothetical protein